MLTDLLPSDALLPSDLLLPDSDENTPPQAPDLNLLYKPVRLDVARILHNRLYAQGGRIGDFLNDTDENGPTDPTADEVNSYIDDAAADVASKVGITLPEQLWPIARRVVSLGTAMLIEIGSENFDQDRYDRLEKLYDTRLAQLLDDAQDVETGGEGGDADDRVLALGSFPPAGHSWDRPAGAEHSWDVIAKDGIGGFEC